MLLNRTILRAAVVMGALALVASCGGKSAPELSVSSFGFDPSSNPGLSTTVSATIATDEITATVPAGTDVTKLVATFSANGKTVTVNGVAQVSGETANDFTSPVTYVVASGATNHAYTVAIAVAASSAKDLTAFGFLTANNSGLSADVMATITGTNVAATVPFGTDPHALVATFSTTGASVSVGATAQTSGTTANDFTNPVTYTVTAADGSTKAYVVTVTVAPSPAKDITSYVFAMADNPSLQADMLGTITGTDIHVTLFYGSTLYRTPPDLTALVATFAHTGTSVKVGGTEQVSGTTPHDFTNPVTYTVTAADGTTKDYKVTVLTVYSGD